MSCEQVAVVTATVGADSSGTASGSRDANRKLWKPTSDKLWEACAGAASGNLKAFVLSLYSKAQPRTASGLMVFHGTVGGDRTPLRCLLDTGASASFISSELARRLGLATRQLHAYEDDRVSLADGTSLQIRWAVEPSLTLSTYTGTWRGPMDGQTPLLLLPGLDTYDVVLGMPFLKAYGGRLDLSSETPRVTLQLPYKSADAGAVLLTPGPSGPSPISRLTSLSAWKDTVKSGEVEQLFLLHARPAVESLSLWDDEDVSPTAIGHEDPPAFDHIDAAYAQQVVEFVALMEKLYGNKVLIDDLPPGLPPSRKNGDLQIRLTDEGTAGPAPFRRSYRMNPAEQDEVKRVITDLVDRGYVRPSQSPYGAPVLFARKKDGSLRFCVDYRALNAITKRDNYPLPRIDELLDRLAGAKFFTSLDLASGYWQIRIEEADVEKTAFQTRYGAFEFLVMPFGLTNAPSAFQRLMNQIFGAATDDFLLVYLDDLLIFSKTWEDHIKHVKQVMDTLEKHKLYAKRKKCTFAVKSVKFLGHIVSEQGIMVDPDKVAAMLSLAAPRNVSDLRSFLGSVNFYRRFIPRCGHRTSPLTDLLRAGASFHWGVPQQRAFEDLKTALATAPVLHPPDMSKQFFLYTDASQVAVGAALMQEDASGMVPVGYASKTLTETERRWATHERELFGVVFGCKAFRHFLVGGHSPPVIRTDHKPLQHLETQRELTPKQARWLEYLTQFSPQLEYVPGDSNSVADMLSRLRQLPLKLRSSATLNVISSVDLHLDGLDREALKAAYTEDTLVQEATSALVGEGDGSNNNILVCNDGLWYRVDDGVQKLYVPLESLQRKLLEEHHDTFVAGHFARDKTFEAVSRNYWWPSLYRDVVSYCQSCPHCQRSKSSTRKARGKLMPLPVPNNPWEVLALDMMGPFPTTKRGFDTVVVYTCLLTKMVHVIPCRQTDTAQDHARLFFANVFRLHGLPVAIVSDRDPRWTSQFWEVLFSKLGSKLQMSTSFHPQTDGQTERANRTIQQIMRCMLAASELEEQEWDEWLPAVEFSYNNAKHASTGMSPFYLNSGQHPRTPASLLANSLDSVKNVPAALSWLERLQTQLQVAQKHVQEAKVQQQHYADRRRADANFEVDQWVKVSKAAFSSTDFSAVSSKKLSPKFYGPFKVARVINQNAVEIAFPASFRGHRVVNVEKLEPWNWSEKFGRTPEEVTPPPLEVRGEQAYEVERFLKRERRRSPAGRPRWEILVSWKNYGSEDDSWEPEYVLKQDLGSKNFQELIDAMPTQESPDDAPSR